MDKPETNCPTKAQREAFRAHCRTIPPRELARLIFLCSGAGRDIDETIATEVYRERVKH